MPPVTIDISQETETATITISLPCKKELREIEEWAAAGQPLQNITRDFQDRLLHRSLEACGRARKAIYMSPEELALYVNREFKPEQNIGTHAAKVLETLKAAIPAAAPTPAPPPFGPATPTPQRKKSSNRRGAETQKENL